MSNLYLISVSTDEGEDKSLFVSADTPVDAVQLWSTHFEQDIEIERTEITHPGREMRFGTWMSVQEVPTADHTVIFSWDDVATTYLLVKLDG